MSALLALLFLLQSRPSAPLNQDDWRSAKATWDKKDYRKGALWQATLDDAVTFAKDSKDRVILYYVYEDKPELDLLKNDKLRAYAEENTSIVRHEYSKDNAAVKELGVKGAPTFVGFDSHLNEFGRLTSLPNEQQFRAFVADIQEKSRKFQEQLKAASAKAMEIADKGDESRAVAELTKIVNIGKRGYPEIEAARAKIASMAESHFARARLLMSKPETEKEGLAALETAARIFKGLPPALSAELELARHFLAKGEIAAAVDHINRVLRADARAFHDEIVKAQDLLGSIVAEGISQIRAALKTGVDGDLEGAKTKIGRIKKDYAPVPEVAKHAGDVLRDLEK